MEQSFTTHMPLLRLTATSNWITEKMLEFSSMVLSAPSPYSKHNVIVSENNNNSFILPYLCAYTPRVIHFFACQKEVCRLCKSAGYTKSFYTICAPCQLWHFFGSWPSDHYFRSVCWFVCLSVCLFPVVLTQYQSVTDGQTDRQTDGRTELL